jgi:monoterpene epsilon-lactone hydrolase
MSIRAKLISLIMARTVRPLFDRVEAITEFRTALGRAERLGAAPPKTISVTPATIADRPCEWITAPGATPGHVLLYLHGGGYVAGGLDSHRDIAWRLAEAAAVTVLLVDYRLAPEHPFPAALDDASACYRYLLDEGFEADKIFIGGDSAGGGLALATLINLKNLGLPLPAKGILLSPWVDLSLSGDSLTSNGETDVMLTARALHDMARMYLGTRDARAPLASPLFGDLRGLPPLLVHASSSELLLSDAERLVRLVETQGGDIALTVWPRMPHVFQLLASRIPEGRQAITQLAEFLRQPTDRVN